VDGKSGLNYVQHGRNATSLRRSSRQAWQEVLRGGCFDVWKFNNILRCIDLPSHVTPSVFRIVKENTSNESTLLHLWSPSPRRIERTTISYNVAWIVDRKISRSSDQGCWSDYHTLKISLEDNLRMMFDSKLLIGNGLSSNIALICCKWYLEKAYLKSSLKRYFDEALDWNAYWGDHI